MKIYFAGPLFSVAEREFNRALTEKLESAGFAVFLPQRDGAERDKPPYIEMSPEERRRCMFDLDRDRILEADIFLIVLDGRVPDEGACVELGIAYAQKYIKRNGKLLVGLQTDIRAAFLGSRLNPMLKVSLDDIFGDEQAMLDSLKRTGSGSG